MVRASALFGALLVSLLSCSGGEETCSLDEDCFAGEVCLDEGVCGPNPDGEDAGGGGDDTDGGENGETSDGGGDDTSNGSDDGGGDDHGGGGDGGGTDTSSMECVVDPFTATCELPDENDDFADYVRMEGECDDGSCGLPGCSEGWDDFVGGQTTIEHVQMCANEHTDRYSTNLIPCDNKSFVVEATMRTTQACDPSLYSFNMRVQGFDCIDNVDPDTMMERVRCETLPDGSKRVTAFVMPSISVGVANLYVEERGEPNVQFDYEIDIVVRE